MDPYFTLSGFKRTFLRNEGCWTDLARIPFGLTYSLFLASLWLVVAEMDSDAVILKGFYLQAVILHDHRYPFFPLVAG